MCIRDSNDNNNESSSFSHVKIPVGVNRAVQDPLLGMHQAPGVVSHEAAPPRALHADTLHATQAALQLLPVWRDVLQVHRVQLDSREFHLGG